MKSRIVKYSLLAGVALLTVVVAGLATVTISAMPAVEVLIDGTQRHQQIEGFGATHVSLVYDGTGDVLSSELRTKAIEAVYQQVGISMGNLEGALLESPGGWNARANDDANPFQINWKGFQSKTADAMWQNVIKSAAPLGFDNYYLSQKVNVRWASPWLESLRQHDYERYLEEIAEQVTAGHLYWRKQYGVVPVYQMLFNEPLSGNRELLNGSAHDIVNIVKRAGARLAAAGFQVKFVLPNEETEEKSWALAKAILADPEARSYVGAIGYHSYPYGSIYSSIPKILATSGTGQPAPDRIVIRNQLRDLGEQYGIPVWMTEISHGDVNAQSFDAFLGRAIHIHDELVYANASAYFGMNNMWDNASQQMHYGNQNLTSQEGTIVLIDNPNKTVSITGMGYAIGHYARWIKQKAVRLEATSANPLIQVSAFWDEQQKRLVLVAINNMEEQQNLNVRLKGLAVKRGMRGEQSTETAYWQALPSVHIGLFGRFRFSAPAKSVTTIIGEGTSS